MNNKVPCQMFFLTDNVKKYKTTQTINNSITNTSHNIERLEPYKIDGIHIISQHWLKNNQWRSYNLFKQQGDKIIFDFPDMPNNCIGEFKLIYLNYSLPEYTANMKVINQSIEHSKETLKDIFQQNNNCNQSLKKYKIKKRC